MKLKLTQKIKTHYAVRDLVGKKIMEFYNKKYNSHHQNSTESSNIMDLMISHNKKCKKTGNENDILSEYEIIGHISAFIIAGLDTSLQLSTSCIMWLSNKYPEWIKNIQKDGLKDFETIEANNSLDLVIKETLRMYSPTNPLFRAVSKDMKLSGV